MKNNDISFDDVKYKPRGGDMKKSGIVNFLIRKGVVKTEGQGETFLIILVLILIASSLYMVNSAFTDTYKPAPLDPQQLINLPGAQVTQ